MTETNKCYMCGRADNDFKFLHDCNPPRRSAETK